MRVSRRGYSFGECFSNSRSWSIFSFGCSFFVLGTGFSEGSCFIVLRCTFEVSDTLLVVISILLSFVIFGRRKVSLFSVVSVVTFIILQKYWHLNLYFGLALSLVVLDVTYMFSIPFIVFGIFLFRVTRLDSITAVWTSVGMISCVTCGIFAMGSVLTSVVFISDKFISFFIGYLSTVLDDFGLFHNSLKKFYTVGNSFKSAYCPS